MFGSPPDPEPVDTSLQEESLDLQKKENERVKAQNAAARRNARKRGTRVNRGFLGDLSSGSTKDTVG
jgi:hypothetical protein